MRARTSCFGNYRFSNPYKSYHLANFAIEKGAKRGSLAAINRGLKIAEALNSDLRQELYYNAAEALATVGLANRDLTLFNRACELAGKIGDLSFRHAATEAIAEGVAKLEAAPGLTVINSFFDLVEADGERHLTSIAHSLSKIINNNRLFWAEQTLRRAERPNRSSTITTYLTLTVALLTKESPTAFMKAARIARDCRLQYDPKARAEWEKAAEIYCRETLAWPDETVRTLADYSNIDLIINHFFPLIKLDGKAIAAKLSAGYDPLLAIEAALCPKVKLPGASEINELKKNGPVDWPEAFRQNIKLNSGDLINNSPNDLVMIGTEKGGRLAPDQRTAIEQMTAFIHRQQKLRGLPSVESGWEQLTDLTNECQGYYFPRFGNQAFRFGEELARLFPGLKVLDVGCRVPPDETPFFEYYGRLGAKTVGIDIINDELLPPGTRVGDVRALPFERASFDFITVPKIFGFGNPADTILEVVAGLSELYRVLDNGLVHLADNCLSPGIVYAANLAGFRYYYHREHLTPGKDWTGLPAGSFLVKKESDPAHNPFQPAINLLAANELDFSGGEGTVPCRDLLILKDGEDL
ncbi:MAG: hypothetical protein WCW67_06830 [Candidatus Margulisiibacteriota bacterium]|jgi:hypothetical protein